MAIRDAKDSGGSKLTAKMAVIKSETGNMLMTDASGFATNGADTASCLGLGIAQEVVDNTGGSAGDKEILYREGCYGWMKNSSANAVAQSHLNTDVFMEDSETVASSTTNSVKAGVAKELDATLGVLVYFPASTP